MIRIDYIYVGQYVQTTWVHEEEGAHSQIGRLLFTASEFGILKNDLEEAQEIIRPVRYRFEHKEKG